MKKARDSGLFSWSGRAGESRAVEEETTADSVEPVIAQDPTALPRSPALLFYSLPFCLPAIAGFFHRAGEQEKVEQ
jgi:hypothetical protein